MLQNQYRNNNMNQSSRLSTQETLRIQQSALSQVERPFDHLKLPQNLIIIRKKRSRSAMNKNQKNSNSRNNYQKNYIRSLLKIKNQIQQQIKTVQRNQSKNKGKSSQKSKRKPNQQQKMAQFQALINKKIIISENYLQKKLTNLFEQKAQQNFKKINKWLGQFQKQLIQQIKEEEKIKKLNVNSQATNNKFNTFEGERRYFLENLARPQ